MNNVRIGHQMRGLRQSWAVFSVIGSAEVLLKMRAKSVASVSKFMGRNVAMFPLCVLRA